ncbi:SRPBCC family protein [Paenarthrobacter sp. NyZ202]|uniref:SRPBCC family protein n=1 Tax=Paenarthrobacter sp. NyZ202 TaxID=3402689 RepID=UPI003CFB9B3A
MCGQSELGATSLEAGTTLPHGPSCSGPVRRNTLFKEASASTRRPNALDREKRGYSPAPAGGLRLPGTVRKLSTYDAFVISSGPLGDAPPGLGTRGRGTTRIMGRQFDWMVEYTEFDPPRRMVSRSIEGERDLTATFTLESVGGGTRVTEQLRLNTPMEGLMGKLPGPLVEWFLGLSLRRNLKNLAKVLAA